MCGTTVIKTRSVSLKERFRIRPGRTFCAMPKSTIQTSPRLGTVFLLIQQGKTLGGSSDQFLVRQRSVFFRNYAAGDRFVNIPLFGARQSLELLQNGLGL